MELKRKIRNLIGKRKEPIEIENINSSDELFAEKKEQKLAKIEKKSVEFTKDAETILENIENSLQVLNEFQDPKDRSVVNDIIENIYEKRKQAVKEVSIPENPKKLENELKTFSEEFQDLNRKEKAVLDEAKLKGEFSKHLLSLEDLLKKLKEFNQSTYKTKERYERVQETKKEIKNLKKQKRDLESQINQKKQQNYTKKIEQKKKDLENLRNSEKQKQYSKLCRDLEKLENEKENTEKKVGRALGKMERGLKKLLYEGEVKKIDKTESEILRQIRDQNKQKILDSNPKKVESSIEAVSKSIKESSLDEKTKEKLKEGLKTLRNFEEISKNYKETKKQIKNLNTKKRNHGFKEKEEKLQKELSKLRERQEKYKNDIRELKNQKEELEQKINDSENQILSIFEEEFEREIKAEL